MLNDYLRSLPQAPLGILISDENKDVMYDVEKSIRLLRGDRGGLGLSQIIEKGFFIESDKSLPLQLCDLCALCLRRLEEQKTGLPIKPLDQNCIPWVQPLIHRGAEPLADVLAWLAATTKKGAARDLVSGTDKVRTTLVAVTNLSKYRTNATMNFDIFAPPTRPGALDFGPWTLDFSLRISDFGLRIF